MRRLKTEEAGATLVIFAVSLVVLVGMAAFVVDIGDAYWERRMLQNSADSAALAVAMDCAQGDCGTPAEHGQVAEQYAADNNVRGARVDDVVGPGGGPPTFAGGSVRVFTSTDSDDGRLRQWFSGILGQDQGLRTNAEALAVWGATDLSTIGGALSPLSISICEFNRALGVSDANLPTASTISSLPTVAEARTRVANGDLGDTIVYKDPQGSADGPDDAFDCSSAPGFYNDVSSGEKLPAAFGWLDSSSCTVPTLDRETVGGAAGSTWDVYWARTKPGASAGNEGGCVKSLRNLDDPVAFFPIYTGDGEGQGRSELQLATVAGFYMTGYRLPGAGPPGWSIDGGSAPCSSPETCIRGHFVSDLAPPGGTPSETTVPAGVSSVQLRE